MAWIYIDPSAAVDGSGSISNPRNTPIGLETSAGDIVMFRAGTRYQGMIPRRIMEPGSITLGSYGTGAKPIIDAGLIVTMRPSEIEGIFEHKLTANLGGNMQIDSVPQSWVEWNNTLVETSRRMAEGSFSFDPKTFTYYSRPTGRLLRGREVKISNVINVISGSGDFNTVRELEIWQASKHAVVHTNMRRFSVIEVDAHLCGGYYDNRAGFYSGNGFEIGMAAIDGLVERCRAYDIFDSAFTAQCYAVETDYGVVHSESHEFNQCESYRCGFSAYEFSVLARGQTLEGIHVKYPIAEDSGTLRAWAYRPGQGNALSVISGARGEGYVGRVICENPQFRRSQYGISNLYNSKPIVISGKGEIVGNMIARVRVMQMGQPSAPKATVHLSQEIITDGVDDLGEYRSAVTST